jgi:glycyl-tRNA synthetase
MTEMDAIVSLCKRRGFVFPGSEVYGGLGGFWDYGPLGVELKNNIKRAWWRSIVQERDDMVGLDAAIIMNPAVWRASGHVAKFSDPMVDCKACKHRFKADDLQGDKCPECGGDLTEARNFNLLFHTFVGPVQDDASIAYLRPETAQGIFVNFANVQTTMRKKLPFGIAQIGKAFRNEITPGNFIFRDREFEQLEIEFFCKPGTDEEWHQRWANDRLDWYVSLGVDPAHLRLRPPDSLAHYAKAAFEIEYLFPMGWGELEGVANRTDYDLKRHSESSLKDLSYFDEETNERVTPYVIEPSAGVDRSLLVFLLDAYREEQVRNEKRTVLKLHRSLAPIKVAVLPLARNRPEIVSAAKDLTARLRKHMMAMYDDTASIGRLYRRQDEIGTPFCITVDHQTVLADDAKYDGMVTVRDRDSMEQVRVPLTEVIAEMRSKLDC